MTNWEEATTTTEGEEKQINGMIGRDCITRDKDEQIIDRFTIFRTTRREYWTAWTGDTVSSKAQNERRKFARLINQRAQEATP